MYLPPLPCSYFLQCFLPAHKHWIIQIDPLIHPARLNPSLPTLVHLFSVLSLVVFAPLCWLQIKEWYHFYTPWKVLQLSWPLFFTQPLCPCEIPHGLQRQQLASHMHSKNAVKRALDLHEQPDPSELALALISFWFLVICLWLYLYTAFCISKEWHHQGLSLYPASHLDLGANWLPLKLPWLFPLQTRFFRQIALPVMHLRWPLPY